jgi:predicted small secreted protein
LVLLRESPHGSLEADRSNCFRLEKEISRIRGENQKIEETMIKRIFLLLVATASLIISTLGCHTVHGAGEDIEHAGQKIQDSSPP